MILICDNKRCVLRNNRCFNGKCHVLIMGTNKYVQTKKEVGLRDRKLIVVGIVSLIAEHDYLSSIQHYIVHAIKFLRSVVDWVIYSTLFDKI